MALGISKFSRHSSMREWMLENRRQFGLELPRRPNWVQIAQFLSDLGLRDADGNKPKPQTARLNWTQIVGPKKRRKSKPVVVVPEVVATQPAETCDAASRRLAANEEIRTKRSVR